ncbi:MAG TPA: DUF494 family protein [Candidatus Kapabacteria bacterium]|nr:DUF494 family protein [Candidatus Kapabacteria bacterium]
MKTEGSNSRSERDLGRVMEIVFYLAGEMRRNKQLADIDLSKLTARGFSESEVSTAFTWLVDKIMVAGIQAELSPVAGERPFDTKGREPFRMFNEMELVMLEPEARGYLIQLRELGLLKDSEMEVLVDRLWMLGAQNISLEEVRDFAGRIIFDFNDATRPGSRMMLSFADRVQ